MISKLAQWYARAPLRVSLLAAALLTATGLGVGFVGDDCYHLMILKGGKTPASDGSLFTFISGDPVETRRFIQTGPFPWWTLPEAKAQFYRPLSVAMHKLDFALFGERAVFWHIHAMLWYLALVALWGLIAREVVSAPVAALATLIFAIDDVHWMPAVWLANRNALVACVPALFGLWAHIRWREDEWRPGLPLSVVGYVIGMFGGEAWLGMAAYVAAYEFAGRTDSVARRALSIAPAAICAVVYAIAYKLSDYGVYGSGAYTEPLSREYFLDAPNRMLSLLGGLLVSSPVDAWGFFPEWRWLLAAAGLAGVMLFGFLLRKFWPRLDTRDTFALRWLILGGVLSMFPVIAAFPMNRLLLGPSLGGSVVVAMILRAWWQGRGERKWRAVGIVCGIIAGIHLVLAPVAWPLQSAVVSFIGRWGEQAYRDAPIDDARVAQQHLVLLAANDPLTLMYPPILRFLDGRPLPASWHVLSASPHDHTFTRTGLRQFELKTTRGALMQGVFAEILRAKSFPYTEGDLVDLGFCRLTLLDVLEGSPTRMRVDCEKPLEDESLVFLVWQDFRLREFALPRTGETVTVRY
ncbi:MAG: hypothetical protein SGI88_06940 [Candidatus Hydrogenedentes bacterium]|nr:hypothetical protein [Candidatus Hydrogenedentota bacterium]